MTVAQHPSRRGFDGLRAVPDPDTGPDPAVTEQARLLIAAKLTQESELIRVNGTSVNAPVAFILAYVGDDSASVTWHGVTDDDIIDAAVIALGAVSIARAGRDVIEWASDERDRRVRHRASLEAARIADEIAHPWVCDCGKRCKSKGGLDTHRRTSYRHKAQT